jgi:hypothetical protein
MEVYSVYSTTKMSCRSMISRALREYSNRCLGIPLLNLAGSFTYLISLNFRMIKVMMINSVGRLNLIQVMQVIRLWMNTSTIHHSHLALSFYLLRTRCRKLSNKVAQVL